jgi:hypothetical protein
MAMKVTRDVVLDLLPLYLSGEASADTRALVVEYLAQDPELARRIRSQPANLFADSTATQLPPDLEVRSLRRARTVINLQKWLFGPAIALTALSLAIVIKPDHGRIRGVHFLMGDYPLQIGAVAFLALACWGGYYAVKRRLRSLG